MSNWVGFFMLSGTLWLRGFRLQVFRYKGSA